MSGFSEQDLIQFWKDANSYQSIDVACFDIEEFKDNWVRDKIGHEALEKANGVDTREKQCNLPVVVCSTWIFFYEGEKDNPQFKVQANTQWEAYQVAEETYGPQVEEMMYCMI